MFSVPDTWGYSSAGRALAWHARGQEFEPPYLHHKESDNHAVYEPRGYFLLHEKSKKVSTRVSNKKNDSNQQQELSFFYSFFKEKGPRMAAKVLCDGPFASDYVTGVGFW